MLSADEVIWGYRFLLGRDPESRDVIEQYFPLADVRAMRDIVMRSEEFQKIQGLNHPALKAWVLTPVMSGKRRMWVSLADKFVSRACLIDNYEPTETSLVRSLVAAGDHFIDIGANIGWFTVLASTLVGPSGRVTAFEPRPETRLYLEQTVMENKLADSVQV
ncbi:MAG: FkbM family methyltransferase, partial [Caulobacteraceae bacterium]